MNGSEKDPREIKRVMEQIFYKTKNKEQQPYNKHNLSKK